REPKPREAIGSSCATTRRFDGAKAGARPIGCTTAVPVGAAAHGWAMRLFRSISMLLARRWQLPLAMAAVVTPGLALSRVKPPEPEVQFDVLLADITALMEGGRHYDAANAAANLLGMKPPLAREQLGILHERLAEIAYRVESMRETPDKENAKLLLQHQE